MGISLGGPPPPGICQDTDISMSKFSIDFWAPSGSIWASRDVPGAPQKPLIFNRFSVASANQPGPASGRLQRVPGCHPDTSLAQFCIDFGSILRVDFDIHSFGGALIFRVKCSRCCVFFLHLSFMHVTLMRAKKELLIDGFKHRLTDR